VCEFCERPHFWEVMGLTKGKPDKSVRVGSRGATSTERCPQQAAVRRSGGEVGTGVGRPWCPSTLPSSAHPVRAGEGNRWWGRGRRQGSRRRAGRGERRRGGVGRRGATRILIRWAAFHHISILTAQGSRLNRKSTAQTEIPTHVICRVFPATSYHRPDSRTIPAPDQIARSYRSRTDDHH
jgi:hypothetical protein